MDLHNCANTNINYMSFTKTKSNIQLPFLRELMLPLLICLFLFSISSDTFAQKRCGTDEYIAKRIEEKPELLRVFNEMQLQSLSRSASRIGCDGSNTVSIPLAFHFDNNFNCSDEACMLSEIYDQIDALNLAFQSNLSSPIAASCPSAYTDVSDGTCISFYLAEPPACADLSTTACNAAITVGEFQGGYSAQDEGNGAGTYGAGACWDDYLNVFILTNANLLGVADQIPGAFPANGPGEGVSVIASTFGGTDGPCGGLDTDASFGLGATLIHEIGHYLGLFHVFQGGCNDEPNNTFGFTNIAVNDTPPQSSDTGGCPTGCVASGCGGNKQTANFMDYSNDACLEMFSQDQAFAMNTVANGLFASLSIPAADPNITDLFGLCPSGQCVLVCPSMVTTQINEVNDFCTEHGVITLSESGIALDDMSDAVYTWSTGDYISNGGTALASADIAANTTPDCTVTTTVYYLNVDCGTTPLATMLDGGTYTINIYPGAPLDLSTLVTISNENNCDEPVLTPIPGCENYVTITSDTGNPSFPVSSGVSGSAAYSISFTPDANGPDCCVTGSSSDLVINGDLESGDAPWTEFEEVPVGSPNQNPFGVIGVSTSILNGTSDAWFGGWGELTGGQSVTSSYTAISQDIDLDMAQGCSALILSFDYLVVCSSNATIDLEVFVGGVSVTSLDCNSNSGSVSIDLMSLALPTGVQTLLIEAFENDPNPGFRDDAGSAYLDNISIIPDCPTTTCNLDISAIYDCASCPNCYSNLTNDTQCALETIETGVADYESSDWISTTQSTLIQNGAQVDYDATDYIELNAEFEVQSGAIFHAFIDGCGGNELQNSSSEKK